MEKFRAQFRDLGRSRYPACVLELKVNQEDLDVNLEPDKSKFLFRREKEVTFNLIYISRSINLLILGQATGKSKSGS